ncbi:MAG: hypothetical protein ACK4MM_06820 [Fervidobacterium sp.]
MSMFDLIFGILVGFLIVKKSLLSLVLIALFIINDLTRGMIFGIMRSLVDERLKIIFYVLLIIAVIIFNFIPVGFI